MSKEKARPECCGQCPLKLDSPRGIWSLEHYASLLHIRPKNFKCHQSRRTGGKLACRGALEVGSPGHFNSMESAGIENMHAVHVLAFERLACHGSNMRCSPSLLKAPCPVCGMELPTNEHFPVHIPAKLHHMLVKAGVSYQSLPALLRMGTSPFKILEDLKNGLLDEESMWQIKLLEEAEE